MTRANLWPNLTLRSLNKSAIEALLCVVRAEIRPRTVCLISSQVHCPLEGLRDLRLLRLAESGGFRTHGYLRPDSERSSLRDA